MRKVDVLISGMGPTGATLAGLLGQGGHQVAIFDRLPDLYPLPRAIGIDHEAMRVMQELGVADRLEGLIAPYAATEFLGMDGQLIKKIVPAPPPWPLTWHPSYSFNQPGFERTIRMRLSELPSVHTYLEAEVVSSGETDGMAWLDVRHKVSGAVERFGADWLVACDGGRSAVRERLGIRLQDLDFDEPWLVVDALVSDEKLRDLPTTHVQYCQAERPATYVIGPGNHRRWEIMLLPGDSPAADFPEAELWPLLQRWLRPGDATLWRAASYRFHGLVAERWREGRALLAGDAAHMTPPFMAQGMAQGLRDAYNLAWKLDRVLRRHSTPQLLDSYQAERRPHVVTTTTAAIGLGRVICERDPAVARARDARMLQEQEGVVRPTIRQNMIPPLVSGIIATDSDSAGEIFPQPVVDAGDGQRKLDDVVGVGFAVYAVDIPAHRELDAILTALAPLQARLVDVSEACGAQGPYVRLSSCTALQDWLRNRAVRFAVVRPDRYVYATCRSVADLLSTLANLQRALGA